LSYKIKKRPQSRSYGMQWGTLYRRKGLHLHGRVTPKSLPDLRTGIRLRYVIIGRPNITIPPLLCANYLAFAVSTFLVESHLALQLSTLQVSTLAVSTVAGVVVVLLQATSSVAVATIARIAFFICVLLFLVIK